jgi:hypothetical protein
VSRPITRPTTTGSIPDFKTATQAAIPSSAWTTPCRILALRRTRIITKKTMAAWDAATAPEPREAADAAARLAESRAAWDDALAVIDEARKSRQQPLACRNPRRRRSPHWSGNGTGWPRTATTR